jgi:hypothetical protein
LNFAIDKLNGTYEGKVNATGAIITGTWSQQGQAIPLEFRRGSLKLEHKPARPSDIDGAWTGSLDTPQGKLRMVFHIVNTEDGLIATLDVPDQGSKGVPVTLVTRNGSALKLEMKQLAGGFTGKISTDLSTIDGTWTQQGNSLPLVIKRMKDAAELERPRPRNPVKPYPNREEEVAYSIVAPVRMSIWILNR